MSDEMAIKKDIVKGVYLFKELEEADIEKLILASEIKNFSKGQVIFEENADADSIYVVIQGSVKVIKKVEKNLEKTLAAFYENDFFGEIALLDDHKRSASVKCITDSKLLVIPTHKIMDLVQENYRIGYILFKNISTIISRRLKETNERFVEILQWKII